MRGGGGVGMGVIACWCLVQKMTGSKTREKYLVIVLRLGNIQTPTLQSF